MKNTLILITCFLLFGNTYSQTVNSGNVRPIRVFFNSGGGVGPNFMYTGIVTNKGADVTINTSGGVRPEIGMSYTIKNKIDLGASLLFQTTSIYPTISNGTGSFDRSFLNISGRYFIYLGKRQAQHINVGASLPILFRSQMLFDFSEIPTRDLEEYNYKKTCGFGILGEYEIETKKRHWAWGAGFEYIFTHYKIDNIRINGEEKPLDYWGTDSYDMYDFKGNSVNFYLRMSYRFGKLRSEKEQ
jgi:hypothetical protein